MLARVCPMKISKGIKRAGTEGGALSADQVHVDASSRGRALADYLAENFLISEEQALDLIDFGSVQINGFQERHPGSILEGGEVIRVYWPWQGIRRHYEIEPARVLYRDVHLFAYDKEAGVPSQQTPADAYNNLYSAVSRYLKGEGRREPYVALHHRLDRETSGVMLFALDRSVNGRLGSAFEHHRMEKDYLAWVSGVPAFDSLTVGEDIGRKAGRYTVCARGEGKTAETVLQVLYRGEGRALVLAQPRTGRTHQIRLHLSHVGHPVIGDRLYGERPAERLYLHAYRLRLAHPANGSDLSLEAPVPPDWPLDAAIRELLHI
jgi:23S rRNA pseudouridine1911/1915/1917 synthase